MDKVKVSLEEAKAFERLKEVIAKRKGSHETSQLVLGFAELTAGYEIERTPEEQILQYVLERQNAISEHQAFDVQLIAKGKIEGVKFALDTLGIKIEGVNAD